MVDISKIGIQAVKLLGQALPSEIKPTINTLERSPSADTLISGASVFLRKHCPNLFDARISDLPKFFEPKTELAEKIKKVLDEKMQSHQCDFVKFMEETAEAVKKLQLPEEAQAAVLRTSAEIKKTMLGIKLLTEESPDISTKQLQQILETFKIFFSRLPFEHANPSNKIAILLGENADKCKGLAALKIKELLRIRMKNEVFGKDAEKILPQSHENRIYEDVDAIGKELEKHLPTAQSTADKIEEKFGCKFKVTKSVNDADMFSSMAESLLENTPKEKVPKEIIIKTVKGNKYQQNPMPYYYTRSGQLVVNAAYRRQLCTKGMPHSLDTTLERLKLGLEGKENWKFLPKASNSSEIKQSIEQISQNIKRMFGVEVEMGYTHAPEHQELAYKLFEQLSYLKKQGFPMPKAIRFVKDEAWGQEKTCLGGFVRGKQEIIMNPFIVEKCLQTNNIPLIIETINHEMGHAWHYNVAPEMFKPQYVIEKDPDLGTTKMILKGDELWEKYVPDFKQVRKKLINELSNNPRLKKIPKELLKSRIEYAMTSPLEFVAQCIRFAKQANMTNLSKDFERVLEQVHAPMKALEDKNINTLDSIFGK